MKEVSIKLKKILEQRCLLLDIWKNKRNLNHKSSFREKHMNMKDGLQMIYNNYNYSERALLKRLNYLQSEQGLQQSFYISLILGAVFLILSLLIPDMMEISSTSRKNIQIHNYMLNNDVYYAEGYRDGISHREKSDTYRVFTSSDLDDRSKSQSKKYWDGYNYAVNNGYNYIRFEFLVVEMLIVYFIYIVILYLVLKKRENNFDKYQTNAFEIDLIKNKLGIIECKTRRYRIKRIKMKNNYNKFCNSSNGRKRIDREK